MQISKNSHNKKIKDNSLPLIFSQNKKSKVLFAVLLILYIAASIVVKISSSPHKPFMLGGQEIPVNAFMGVFSSLANICLIFMVLFFGKIGYYTSIFIFLIQFPLIIRQIIAPDGLANLPGVFGNLLTITAVTIIYFKNKKVDEYQERLHEQAVTDRLTGLPNRFACSELISDLIRRGEKFALVHIDINNFKGINNTMGFETGNKVLIEIASRWKNIADGGDTGTSDFITRVNGDEFILIIRSYNSTDDILKTIEQYESVLGNRLTIENCDFYITASFGYSLYPSDAKNIDSLFSYADAAMHEVKRVKSSDHILHFTPDLLKIERTIEIESKIREALKNDEIFFNLQPQYDMSHKLRGFEALARMKDTDGSIMHPTEFINVAEKVGLIDKVDGAVFRKTALFFGELVKKTGADITLSINASVRHLMKNNFVKEVKNLLEVSGLQPHQLEIEITESIMIDSAEKAFQCINEIKDMGIKIAIDDFGTGYSSLSYLNNFPANLLKIDKSFIDKMNSSDSSKQYVAAIISIGHIMGFDVISEGVEEQEQLETLKNIGCDYIQGFFWGHPLSQEDAEKLVWNCQEMCSRRIPKI